MKSATATAPVPTKKPRNVYVLEGKVRLKPNGQVEHTLDEGKTWLLGMGPFPPMGERDILRYVKWRKGLPKPSNMRFR